LGTLVICAMFAAMVGISSAALVAMGTIALPSMLERGYDKKLALGVINTGGGWGILIPPSILMILYALITGVSVGQMFDAGIMPGVLLIVLTVIYFIVCSIIQPHISPPLYSIERCIWADKLQVLKA